MKIKAPPDSPHKEQLKKIAWILGGEELIQENFVGDVVHLVQNYVTVSNRTIMDLKKQIGMLSAELERTKKDLYDATHRT